MRGTDVSEGLSLGHAQNRLCVRRVGPAMRRRLTLLVAFAAPFVLAGCGKGKY